MKARWRRLFAPVHASKAQVVVFRPCDQRTIHEQNNQRINFQQIQKALITRQIDHVKLKLVAKKQPPKQRHKRQPKKHPQHPKGGCQCTKERFMLPRLKVRSINDERMLHGRTPLSGLTQVARRRPRKMTLGTATTVVHTLSIQKASGYQIIQ